MSLEHQISLSSIQSVLWSECQQCFGLCEERREKEALRGLNPVAWQRGIFGWVHLVIELLNRGG